MDVLRIEGGIPLGGAVAVSGAKNAALPIMAAAILAEGPVRLTRVPAVSDVSTLAHVLIELGIDVAHPQPGKLQLTAIDPQRNRASRRHVRRMRASFCVLGPLLARRRRAMVALPGGCSIGPRPIDLHLQGLRALGAEIRVSRGYVLAKARRLRGTTIDLAGPHGSTVTGTANVLCAATLARGQTIIRGAAREPEIVDLGHFLQKLGARIAGLGTDELEVRGVDQLGAVDHELIPDRIEAGTLLAAAAITGGSLTLNRVEPAHLTRVLEVLSDAGATIIAHVDSISLSRTGALRPINVTAAPYPDFPTDLQAQFTALACRAAGTSRVTEQVFPERFAHAVELRRMGPRLRLCRSAGNTTLEIAGGAPLVAARLKATDLRASAALVVAALAAQGTPEIRGLQHLDRGYDDLAGKLRSLGARIERVGTDVTGFTSARPQSKLAL